VFLFAKQLGEKKKKKRNFLKLTVRSRSNVSKLQMGNCSLVFKIRAAVKIEDLNQVDVIFGIRGLVEIH
jgi:hypothetical protein